ncbi:cytochrome P450 [Aliiroseovarius halocynthiae]|uniref:cytochrome P450 n=1 Tax=Aliiroseovarius halocynthiae TaxID=985055 RepID=UPI0038990C1C
MDLSPPKATKPIKTIVSDLLLICCTVKLLLVHLNPAHWDNPIRFLNWQGAGRDAYLPFGAGGRICPGSIVVNQQLTFALSTICQSLALTKDPDTRSGDLKQMFRIVLEPCEIVKFSAAHRLQTRES